MKIFKISQVKAKAVDPAVAEQINEAILTLQNSIATINQSLKIIETTGANQLFQRNNIINAITSGNLQKLNVNTINQALQAMTHISQTVPLINSSMKVLKENATAAQGMNLNINTVMNSINQSLRSGDYSQFTAQMQGFQQNLSGMSGTIQNTVK